MKKILFPFLYVLEVLLLCFTLIGYAIVSVSVWVANKLPNKEWYKSKNGNTIFSFFQFGDNIQNNEDTK